MRLRPIRSRFPILASALAAALLALPAGGLRAQDGEAPAGDAAVSDPVEAVVNGTELRRSDVLESARDLPRAYQDQIEQIYPALVERLIDLTLLHDEAARRQLQSDPAVREKVAAFEAQVMREVLLEAYLAEHMTEPAIDARYDRFVAEFEPQQEIHARHILVETEEEAKAIIAELDAGGDFAAIAQERSTDTGSGADGGDLGFFTADQMVPEFAQAAVALAPGSYSATPVKSRFGWHVIKVEETRETTPPSLEEARPAIEDQLSQELVSQLVEELRADAEIERMTPTPDEPDAAPEASPDAPPDNSMEEAPAE